MLLLHRRFQVDPKNPRNLFLFRVYQRICKCCASNFMLSIFKIDHVLQFNQDGTDLEKIPKWGEHYPFAFPMQFSPDSIHLFVHHPAYVKPILATTGKILFAYNYNKLFMVYYTTKHGSIQLI